MKFKTMYVRERHFADPGDPKHILYSMQLQADGTYDLEKTGVEDWHEIIGSYAESCNLDSILERYKNGDPDALNQRAAHFGDFADMPKDQFEIYRNIKNGEANFDKLPIEVKNKFDNSFDKFVSMIGSDAWFKYMQLDNAAPDPAPAPDHDPAKGGEE